MCVGLVRRLSIREFANDTFERSVIGLMEHDERTTSRSIDLLKTIFAIDAAAMTFFLIVRPGPTLPLKLPFEVGPSLPFKLQIAMLAGLATVSLVFQTLNLFFHGSAKFRKILAAAVALLLASSLLVIGLGGAKLFNTPAYLLPP